MRRASTVLVSMSLLVAVVGCARRYEERKQKTFDGLKEAKRLDENLQPAPVDGKLKEISVYVRAPKGMERAKQFQLTALPPGKFDADESYLEGNKSSMHVLARYKAAKKATPKKGEPPVEQVPRGEFTADVREIIGAIFNDPDALAPEKAKDKSVSPNTFKFTSFNANNKNIQVYVQKADPYETALIFVVDPADAAALSSRIEMCLKSFATGSKAKAKYDNAGGEESGEEGEGEGVAAF